MNEALLIYWLNLFELILITFYAQLIIFLKKFMQTLTINIQNKTLTEKVLWMLEHFKSDGLEISSKEDLEDLKLLTNTRNEGTVSFENHALFPSLT